MKKRDVIVAYGEGCVRAQKRSWTFATDGQPFLPTYEEEENNKKRKGGGEKLEERKSDGWMPLDATA